MPKKKGNLKAALNGHFAQQEQKARERAAQEAARRKALSVTKSGASKSKNHKHRSQPALPSDVDGAASNDTSIDSRPVIKKRRRLPQPFARDDTILIVGEANFSFTLSLLLPPRAHPPSNILATAYDSEQECFSKYPDARENVERIRRLAGRDDIVLFGVDAGQLEKYKQVTGASSKSKSQLGRNLDDGYQLSSTSAASGQRRWSKVWFGFPHVGAGHKDETRNVLANQLLILRFLVSVAPYLTVGALPAHAPGSSSGSNKRSDSDDEDEIDPDPAADALDADDDLLTRNAATTDADQSILDETQARIAALQPFSPPSRQGSVLITLRNASPYTLWDVANLAKRLPQMLPVIASTAPALPKGVKKPTLKDLTASGLSTLSPNNLHSRAVSQFKTGNSSGGGGGVDSSGVKRYRSYHLWRSFEFDPNEWRGYQHRRTIGWVEGVSSSANEDLLRSRSNQRADQEQSVRASKAGGGECRTWEFGLA
ncbi:25S rRNA (uridine(2634)-N(3))-methyltransferase [Pseudozyma hubeiensis]|nr:25S rRNA (uridine(2634)-N(3))-methyltransferase [Pseudozyma hubeiensis]